jgi:aspartate kinase
MSLNIFKFGGASVNSAAMVRNVAAIVKRFSDRPLIVVISAMGKTTNALEQLLDAFMARDPLLVIEHFSLVENYHREIMKELFPNPGHPVFDEVDSFFNQLRGYIRKGHLYSHGPGAFDQEYDQMVSYGELISSSILHHYLADSGVDSYWHNVRELIRTDDTYRDARVEWEETGRLIRERFRKDDLSVMSPGTVHIVQGFLGSEVSGNTTTLGREGSDFTAAIFAFCLNVPEIVIWKDVPGVMNADPKWMSDAVKLETLSYREAIELAYYGASVIHPKTIRPLENAGSTLHVKSFVSPEFTGTVIKNLKEWKISIPVFIRKQHQMLISLSRRDFSFIMEDHLGEIFQTLARNRVKVNVMHNSAISFSICVDDDERRVQPLIRQLSDMYEVRYNDGVELITIRHYNDNAIKKVTAGRRILMELRSRNTIQMVLR